MSVLVPFPPPNQHTEAIRDLQERFQLLERNLTKRLNEMMRNVDRFIRERQSPAATKYKDYNYADGDFER